MRILDKKNIAKQISEFDFKNLMNNNTFLIVFSVFAALFVWYNVVSQENDAVVTVRNVPVELDFENSSLTNLKLSPVGNTEFYVDVDIEGLRSVVGSVEPEDLKVVGRATNIMAPGEYSIAMEGFDNKNRGVIIKSISPKDITVKFDHFIERTIPVEKDLTTLEIEDGYILNQDYVSPAEVTLKGPAGEIEKVAAAKVTKDFQKPIQQTTSFEAPIVLVDFEGNEIVPENMTVSDTTASVTLPILKKKTVPITIELIGTPPGFDEDSIEFTIEPREIELAGPVSTINNLSELHLGYVDLRILEPMVGLTYELELPPGYISVENVRNAEVSYEGNNIGEKYLNATEIKVKNPPSDYNIAVKTKTFFGIKVFGPEEQLAKVSAENVIAEIDMTEIDLRTGTSTVPVSFAIPDCDGCWVFGNDYSAVITVTKK